MDTAQAWQKTTINWCESFKEDIYNNDKKHSLSPTRNWIKNAGEKKKVKNEKPKRNKRLEDLSVNGLIN